MAVKKPRWFSTKYPASRDKIWCSLASVSFGAPYLPSELHPEIFAQAIEWCQAREPVITWQRCEAFFSLDDKGCRGKGRSIHLNLNGNFEVINRFTETSDFAVRTQRC